MSFTTPTVDVYVPGTTLGLGNVNASTINIGQPGTTVNVGGTMAVTNSVTTPSCTMSSLTTGNLIISPFSGNVAFNQFSAINASFNSLNSSNILIGPYPISGTFTDLNVTNASVTTLNVSNFLITPLSNNPTFARVGIGTNPSDYTLDVNGSSRFTGTTMLGKTIIYEAIGTRSETMSSTSGSLIIQHGNRGGGSSIVFPNRNNASMTDYGYICYRDDRNNSESYQNTRSRLEIGVENNTSSGNAVNYDDALILNKNGGNVGIGTVNPFYTLDVNGNSRIDGIVGIGQGLPIYTLDVNGTTRISGNVGIGTIPSAYTLDVNGTAYFNGTTTINGNITMGTGKNIILQPSASYVTPSGDTMLGGITLGTYLTPTSNFSSTKTIATLPVVKGTFMIFVNFEANFTTFPTTNYVNFTVTTAAPNPTIVLGPSQPMPAGKVAYFGAVAITFTTAGTLNLQYNVGGGTINTITTTNFYSLRIA